MAFRVTCRVTELEACWVSSELSTRGRDVGEIRAGVFSESLSTEDWSLLILSFDKAEGSLATFSGFRGGDFGFFFISSR